MAIPPFLADGPQKEARAGFYFFSHNVLLHYYHHISKNWRPILPCSYFWTFTDFIFRQQENLVDNKKCQAGFRPLCNKIPFRTSRRNSRTKNIYSLQSIQAKTLMCDSFFLTPLTSCLKRHLLRCRVSTKKLEHLVNFFRNLCSFDMCYEGHYKIM